MSAPKVPELLRAWRDADRRWEATSPDDPGYAAVRQNVLIAWMRYQEAAGSFGDSEIVLVADDDLRYVAANRNAERLLGFDEGEILGKTVADLTPDRDAGQVADLWKEFILAGRQDGHYTLRTKGGGLVRATYFARAHFPVATLHTSRLRVLPEQSPHSATE